MRPARRDLEYKPRIRVAVIGTANFRRDTGLGGLCVSVSFWLCFAEEAFAFDENAVGTAALDLAMLRAQSQQCSPYRILTQKPSGIIQECILNDICRPYANKQTNNSLETASAAFLCLQQQYQLLQQQLQAEE